MKVRWALSLARAGSRGMGYHFCALERVGAGSDCRHPGQWAEGWPSTASADSEGTPNATTCGVSPAA